MAAETPITYLTHWGHGTNWTAVFLCSITLEKDFNPTSDYTSFSIIVTLEEKAEDDIQVINYNQKTTIKITITVQNDHILDPFLRRIAKSNIGMAIFQLLPIL